MEVAEKKWNLPVLMFCGRAKVALGGCEGGSRPIKMQLTGPKGRRRVYTEPSWGTQNGNSCLDLKTHKLYLSAAQFDQGKPGADGKAPRPTMVPNSFTVLVYGE